MSEFTEFHDEEGKPMNNLNLGLMHGRPIDPPEAEPDMADPYESDEPREASFNSDQFRVLMFEKLPMPVRREVAVAFDLYYAGNREKGRRLCLDALMRWMVNPEGWTE